MHKIIELDLIVVGAVNLLITPLKGSSSGLSRC